MESQIFEYQQKVKLTHEIKSTLDSWVRHEANVREREQREIVSHVIAKVKADLQNPKLVFLVFYKKYNDLMNQTLLDIEGNF